MSLLRFARVVRPTALAVLLPLVLATPGAAAWTCEFELDANGEVHRCFAEYVTSECNEAVENAIETCDWDAGWFGEMLCRVEVELTHLECFFDTVEKLRH